MTVKEEIRTIFEQNPNFNRKKTAQELGVSERYVYSLLAKLPQPNKKTASTRGKKAESDELASMREKLAQAEADLAFERARIEAMAPSKNPIIITTTRSNTIRFGLTSDRHIGSLYHDGDALKAFYDYAKQAGVKQIFDAGDILDGHKIYRGQEFELQDLGFERQLERVIEKSPRSIRTEFITGNHDDSFKHIAGADAGRAIASAIPNYNFLGATKARYIWKTPNGDCILDLLHPGGGTAYALSYKSQKIVDALEGGTKPDIMGIGHFHKAEMIPSYRNICVIQAGTFQAQTPFMARGGLAAHLGGWIIEVKIGPKKQFKTISGEFVAFYHRKNKMSVKKVMLSKNE